MDRVNYYQVSKTYSRVELKPSSSKNKEYLQFYEKYSNDQCFKVIWKYTGNGGECEIFSITEISKTEFERI